MNLGSLVVSGVRLSKFKKEQLLLSKETEKTSCFQYTLRTGINVRSGINVLAGKFSKNNKHTVWNKHTGGQ